MTATAAGQATNVRDAAKAYAERGWPIFPLRARSKVPLTLHGFKDATTDERTILRWFERWPNANLGVVCGEPGPTVLDIDNLGAAGDLATRCSELGAPAAATARGVQFYFAGTDNRTIGLGYGELRSCGSYVVAPPSIHPTGKVYTWIAAPRKTLPGIPDIVARRIKDRSTAGSGKAPVRERVPPGQMYEYLLDRSVRLVRAGEADPDIIEAALVAVFKAKRVPGTTYGDPAVGRRDTRRMAEWAANSEIADREAKREALAGRPLPVRAPRPIGGAS